MKGEYPKSFSKSDIHTNLDLSREVVVDDKYGTPHDEMDMDRMGKLQQLRV
jgi:hypothetical protein